MAVWVDERPKQSYEGCLVVMNIGQENINDVPSNEKDKVVEAIAKAHAGGCIVLYVFDSDIGPMPPPEEFDFIPEMDATRMGFDVLSMRTIQFSSDAEKQRAEMEKWESDNGIDMSKLHEYLGGGMMGGKGHHGGPGMMGMMW